MNWHYLKPVDVLFLRGNKLFGEPGSYGESLVPPWPSVAAGAIRTAILVRDDVDLDAFKQGREHARHPTLGTPNDPGPFYLRTFRLARETDKGPEAIYALPADLLVTQSGTDTIGVHRLQPRCLEHGIASSMPTAKLPVLSQRKRCKPDSGWWLTEAGYADYLLGKTPQPTQLINNAELLAMDERLGIALDKSRRSAAEGKIYTTQAVALKPGFGFLVATQADALNEPTLLRLGGDGRAVHSHPARHYHPPAINAEEIAAKGRCRIVLASPGLFPRGWRLPGMKEDGSFELAGVSGKVVAAAVGRAEVVSGWDLARWQPKTAQRTAPTGSVYWIEELQASPEAMAQLAENGLWPADHLDPHRKAEGFNRFDFAIY